MSEFRRVLNDLGRAHADGPDGLEVALREATARLGEPELRERIREEVTDFLAQMPALLLTDVGILSDESLLSGAWQRLGSKVAPAPDLPLQAFDEIFDRATSTAIAALDVEWLEHWFAALVEDAPLWEDRASFGSAMVILATRAAGAGLETRLLERLPSLTDWSSPFVRLARVVDDYAECYVNDEHFERVNEAREAVDACLLQVADFRIRKQELGTTFHLSSASLRMLQQLRRLRLLVLCTDPDERAKALAQLTIDLCTARSQRFPTLHFLDQKLELIAYLAVGYAARKGEYYAVRFRDEYWGFWRKSLFGGLIVAVFGSAKLHLAFEDLAIAPQAFVYGVNYAVCFALIYVLGASLATKQPAFTASRLAESLEEGPDHESFPELVRSIWRSQFVSFLGNIIGAAVCSLGLVLAYVELTGEPFVTEEKAAYLLDKMHPTKSGTIWYAAVAGVMLSLAGFFAGFVDNAIVFHRVADRVRAKRGVFRFVPSVLSEWFADRIDKKSGGMASNVLLGFLLGSAGGIGVILGLPFDIRHVAFSSSHTAIALFYTEEIAWQLVVTGFGAVAVIGLVNFIVSFGLTLAVAVQARRVAGSDWRGGFRGVARMFRADPLGFLLPKPPDEEAKDD